MHHRKIITKYIYVCMYAFLQNHSIDYITQGLWHLEMAVKPYAYKLKPFTTLSFIFFSLMLLILIRPFLPNPRPINELNRLQNDYYKAMFHQRARNPRWYNVLAQAANRREFKVGLVNMDDEGGQNDVLHGLAEMVSVVFDRAGEDHRWEDFFPEWIDEEEKWGLPLCPEIPMPRFEDYNELDVVVARVPCGGVKEGVRDVFRLQVNLIVANLLARNGWRNLKVDRTVYAVFIGSCGPMWEIFRCDDLLWHQGDHRVYQPDLERLKEKVLMPVGSCQLASSHAGKQPFSVLKNIPRKPREAYVTVLHSSESYVCGAIALAQSIIQTNSTKDLILLADNSILTKSMQGLRAAGWKVKCIKRIQSPHAVKDAYNEWNYSKLRIWELTEYDKLIFIDSDIVVLKNIDEFFGYPQLSAAGNDKFLFNSGVMLVEPSKCTFKTLMENRYKVNSYNGGDQGFLNEMFTWWHRWPSSLNRLKIFRAEEYKKEHEILGNLYTIHYLGLKPWACYMDYDCNWDKLDHHRFASDAAHFRWWQVYKAMPKRLQSYCALTENMEARIRKWRGIAKDANMPDGHWKIKIEDPRQHHS